MLPFFWCWHCCCACIYGIAACLTVQTCLCKQKLASRIGDYLWCLLQLLECKGIDKAITKRLQQNRGLAQQSAVAPASQTMAGPHRAAAAVPDASPPIPAVAPARQQAVSNSIAVNNSKVSVGMYCVKGATQAAVYIHTQQQRPALCSGTFLSG